MVVLLYGALLNCVHRKESFELHPNTHFLLPTYNRFYSSHIATHADKPLTLALRVEFVVRAYHVLQKKQKIIKESWAKVGQPDGRVHLHTIDIKRYNVGQRFRGKELPAVSASFIKHLFSKENLVIPHLDPMEYPNFIKRQMNLTKEKIEMGRKLQDVLVPLEDEELKGEEMKNEEMNGEEMKNEEMKGKIIKSEGTESKGHARSVFLYHIARFGKKTSTLYKRLSSHRHEDIYSRLKRMFREVIEDPDAEVEEQPILKKKYRIKLQYGRCMHGDDALKELEEFEIYKVAKEKHKAEVAKKRQKQMVHEFPITTLMKSLGYCNAKLGVKAVTVAEMKSFIKGNNIPNVKGLRGEIVEGLLKFIKANPRQEWKEYVEPVEENNTQVEGVNNTQMEEINNAEPMEIEDVNNAEVNNTEVNNAHVNNADVNNAEVNNAQIEEINKPHTHGN